ncbi:MAG: D-sedoheptulose 7-phosphate isomerase [Alphaproteobacteria bacterium]|jgi:D-sedoheptulose 7-phosphate isomerase
MIEATATNTKANTATSIAAVENVQEMMTAHIDAVTSFFPKNATKLSELAVFVADAITNGKKIMLCGNGGSASDAQHIAAEFVGRFVNDRRALASIALTTDTSILTAVGNDYGYDEVFARQVEGLGKEGDILIAISTSGNSENVIRAVNSAKLLGMQSVSLTGKSGGKLHEMCDFNFCVEHSTTAHIQECHITFLHMLCALVEKELGF